MPKEYTGPPRLVDLRRLRRQAELQNASLASDLVTFRHLANNRTFRRLPTDASNENLNVTSTCTALMTFAVAYQMRNAFGESADQAALEAFKAVVEYRWKSSGLEEGNPFTAALILRAAGVLAQRGIAAADALRALEHDTKRLDVIALELSRTAPSSLAIQAYPPAPTIAYWYVDGVQNLGIQIEDRGWIELAEWANVEFCRQVSLLSAPNEAMMDPVAMAMAACLSARLRRIASSQGFGARDQVLGALPSSVELVAAVRRLFDFQGRSGLWPKYFPLFHYPEAGANHTFSFELLEAILKEFGPSVVVEPPAVLDGLRRGARWTTDNRLTYFDGAQTYSGWNSGGQIATLKGGVPESWATGVVHMFLFKLRERLSEAIEERVIARYRGPNASISWNRLIDTPLQLVEGASTLKGIIREDILDLVDKNAPSHEKLRHARSALLFGPPGTSKTSIARAVASELQWPYLEINPSHFLRDGLNGIYSRADVIFRDLQDLSRVVILFDEMDALVQRRPAGGVERLDVTREFLTTSMLPKLAELHDQGRVLFFMATNHQSAFDEAIKRPGRFDLLLHVAPPTFESKLANIDALWVGDKGVDDVDHVRDKLFGWTGEKAGLKKNLDLFTFTEFKGLLNAFRQGFTLRHAVDLGNAPDTFMKESTKWAQSFITLRKQSTSDSARAEFEDDREASRRQWH